VKEVKREPGSLMIARDEQYGYPPLWHTGNLESQMGIGGVNELQEDLTVSTLACPFLGGDWRTDSCRPMTIITAYCPVSLGGFP